ncbi:MAG: fluoride efflux transporter CrcB [Rhodospirillales bacterium]|nr:fluoride efflux transporter CrcB [Alphaproteobacteria bacterium]MCB1839819.1 fluoride efflux transporter CrcB [Alphaproteobacteria bacterium]MCB9976425.1 fluoride efflux transporter CrcB [Rhodospirillales bacterium]
MISTIAAIATGGAIGAVARHGVNVLAGNLMGTGFPWGTITVNILGSFLMGVLIVKFAHMDGVSQETRAFFTTGFLGAFTTFSTFSLDFSVIWERGDLGMALAYMLSSVILSVLALFAGLWVMRGLVA